jgi:hypothetical protein
MARVTPVATTRSSRAWKLVWNFIAAASRSVNGQLPARRLDSFDLLRTRHLTTGAQDSEQMIVVLNHGAFEPALPDVPARLVVFKKALKSA